MLFAHRPMYDLLFGDAPMERWPTSEDRTGPAWDAFKVARRAWQAGDRDGAIATWRTITRDSAIETRHVAQAWSFLRSAGETPTGDEGDLVLGAVLEVWVNAGLDVVAGYADKRAFYLGHAGRAEVWDRADDRHDAAIGRVLQVAANVVRATGVHEGERWDPAMPGNARVSVITPAGLHFGQAPASVFFRDPLAGPLLAAGADLIGALTASAAAAG
jgi:hypothetical protein